MALESRYGGDNRFKLTESFMDIPEASDKEGQQMLFDNVKLV